MQIVNFKSDKESLNTPSKVLIFENILVGQKSTDKETAIVLAGKLLVDSGYVEPEYIDAIKEREKMLTTYIGKGIAIPHGIGEAKDKIIKSGISIIQYPDGVDFGNGKLAFLVIGIAGKGNEHMKIISNLAELVMEEDALKELFKTTNKVKIFNSFVNKL